MAGSRLERLGTIFTRMTGLMKAGAVKVEDKPIWYDVYKRFPPLHEPTFNRPPAKKEIINILYPEDVIRAKFYKKFGSPGVIDINNQTSKSFCQVFVEKYMQLEKEGKVTDEDLFALTTKTLEAEGVILPHKKTGEDKSSPQQHDETLVTDSLPREEPPSLKVSDMFRQAVTEIEEKT